MARGLDFWAFGWSAVATERPCGEAAAARARAGHWALAQSLSGRREGIGRQDRGGGRSSALRRGSGVSSGRPGRRRPETPAEFGGGPRWRPRCSLSCLPLPRTPQNGGAGGRSLSSRPGSVAEVWARGPPGSCSGRSARLGPAHSAGLAAGAHGPGRLFCSRRSAQLGASCAQCVLTVVGRDDSVGLDRAR